MNILISFGFIVFGFLIIRFYRFLVDNTGRLGFAENNLGSGATYSVAKVLGILSIIAGIYFLFNPIV